MALAEFGVTGVSDAEKDHLALGWRRLDPWPDVVAGMTRLKQRFTVAALSNGNIALVTEMAKRSGIPWDVILGADFVRTYKPMPVLYDSAPLLLDLVQDRTRLGQMAQQAASLARPQAAEAIVDELLRLGASHG